MADKRQIDIFSAGCPACQDAIDLVNDVACGSCSVTIHDMHDDQAASRARSLGIERVPAVVVDGELLECCQVGGVSADSLRAAGVGKPLD